MSNTEKKIEYVLMELGFDLLPKMEKLKLPGIDRHIVHFAVFKNKTMESDSREFATIPHHKLTLEGGLAGWTP